MSANTPTIVEVEETLTGRYLQTARTGRHALIVDEPEAVGGNDAGPGPSNPRGGRAYCTILSRSSKEGHHG